MRAHQDSATSAIALALAALALGHALQFANGAYTPEALFWVSVALVLSIVAVASIAFKPAVVRVEVALVTGLGVLGVIEEISVHLTTQPGVYMRVGAEAYITHHRMVAACAVLAGVLLAVQRRWVRTAGIVAFVGLFIGLGFWMLKASPSPIMDVFTWHKVAYAALGQGKNPWAIFMPNVYGTTIWYAPGLADAAQVKVGYPYPPLMFMLGGIAHLVASDYRYAHVLAYAAAGLMMALARPGPFGPLAAAIFFFTPRSLFVIEQGWTEPLAALMFAGVVFCACRFPKAMPYALGLLFAVKQYFVLLAPLVVLLMPGPFAWLPFRRVMVKAVIVAAVLTVPFFLWDPGAFWRSVVEFQGRQPFRIDALSFVAATAENGQPTMPLWLAFPAAIPGVMFALFRGPKTPAGFAAGSALTFLLFFAFAKQAFCNYYFLIVCMLCMALAVTVAEPE
jgi:hypothetical protein